MITFIGRERELAALEKEYQKPGLSLYPIYGRRRIGKTELIKRFIANKPHIYFQAVAGTEKENVRNFKEAAKELIDLSGIKDEFEAVFKHLATGIKGKLIIAIDEYPFLVSGNNSFSSRFQRIVDLYLSSSEIMLILCGSSVGMMYKEVLGYKAPLYGRRTGQIELLPLTFPETVSLLGKPLDECVRIYGVCGGVPFYLKEFTENEPFEKLIEQKVLSEESILSKEAEFLLREELNEISKYSSIISAVSAGRTRLGEITDFCGFSERISITPYINTLERLGIIKKEVSAEKGGSGRGIYTVSDEFFRFHFTFVRPYQSNEARMNAIKERYNTHLGCVFEKIAVEFISRNYPSAKAGRWWHRGREIDIAAYEPDSKRLLLLECKWGDMTEKDARRVIGDLTGKSKHLVWPSKESGRAFGLIARNVESKAALAKDGFVIYDINDMAQQIT